MNTKIKKSVKLATQAMSQAEKAYDQRLLQFEQLLLAALKSEAITAKAVEAYIAESEFFVSEAEHEESKPVKQSEIALANLQDFLTKKPANELILKAFGKYAVHAFSANESNGTSLSTYYIYNKLISNETVYLSDVLTYVRQFLPSYSSSGHFNTIKRLLKAAGFSVNVSKGCFSISK